MQHGYVGLYVCCMLVYIRHIHHTLIAQEQEAMFCLQYCSNRWLVSSALPVLV